MSEGWLPLHSMMSKSKKLIVIVGPTASGKTQRGIEYALKHNAHIFSCDSRQIYSELNIGVARPSEEELSTVPHHFIASHSIHDKVDAGVYEDIALAALTSYYKEKDVAILCGGTGLYVEAVVNGLDNFPEIDLSIITDLENEFATKGLAEMTEELLLADIETYNQIDLQNSRRVIRALSVIRQTGQPFSSFKTAKKKERNFATEVIYINPDRAELYEKINLRVDKMIANGLEEEVRNLYQYKDMKPLQTVGYSELFAYFDGNLSYLDTVDKIKQNSRNYAKRQVTFFTKKISAWQI